MKQISFCTLKEMAWWFRQLLVGAYACSSAQLLY